MKRLLLGFLVFFFFTGAVFAAPVSRGPRELGETVLGSLLIQDGKIVVNVDSGGCTGKESFRIDVKQENGLSEKTPHYVLTFERIAVDECKALLMDGVELEYDLEKDLGLSGYYTLSVTNRVYPRTKNLF